MRAVRRQIGGQAVVVAQFLYGGRGIHVDLRLQNRASLFCDGDGLPETCFGDRHGWGMNKRFPDQYVELWIVVGRPPFFVWPVALGARKGLGGLVLFGRFHFRRGVFRRNGSTTAQKCDKACGKQARNQ